MPTEPELFVGAFDVFQSGPQVLGMVLNASMHEAAEVRPSGEKSTVCNEIPDVVEFSSTHDDHNPAIVLADHRMGTAVADVLDRMEPKNSGFSFGGNVREIHNFTQGEEGSQVRLVESRHDSSACKNRKCEYGLAL